MAIEIRNPGAEELRPLLEVLEGAFGGGLENADEAVRSARETMPLDRAFGAYDDGAPVACAAAYAFDLRIPGGELPCGGVTWVGVLPSHRRRGLARDLMRRQLDDLHERGEPLAALWASESLIYERFGYGLAAPVLTLDAVRSSFALRDDPGPAGKLRLLSRDEALEALPPLYDRARAGRPGSIVRTPLWWREAVLQTIWDPPGAGHRFHALLELDGEPAGYAIYRVQSKWERSIPEGAVAVAEVAATSPRAERELWRFLFSVDLTTRVTARRLDPASLLFLGVRDPRRLRLGLEDGLWLRLVDVEAALRARAWNGDDALVLEVRDEFCPWNDGRHRAGAGGGRTDDAADLALSVADLGSLYLGGADPQALARAGRAEELTAGALERAAALFRTPVPPFCSEVF